jgi:hypothetical protein
MASPVADSYSAASGATIYGGRSGGLPAWVPAAGVRANASLNQISDVYPAIELRGGTHYSGILNAWCSTVYAKDLGQYGSILVSGGGHQDYLYNEVYRYDIASRQWARFADPIPFTIPVSVTYGTQGTSQADGDHAGNGVSDLVYNEYWTDDTKSAVLTGRWCPTHTYGQILHVPGSAVGNTNGWLVTLGNFGMQCHKVDLDSPTAGWSRMGALLSTTGRVEQPGYGCAIFDPVRSRIVSSPYNNGAQPYVYTIGLPSVTLASPSSDYLTTYYTLGFYDAADDLYIISRIGDVLDTGGRWKMYVLDPVTFAVSAPPSSGDVPPTGPGTVEWIESLRQLVYWPGSGTALYFAQAPANPKTGTWVWTMRDFGGDAPALQDSANPMYKRLHYVPALNALVHVGKTTGPVQIWKL